MAYPVPEADEPSAQKERNEYTMKKIANLQDLFLLSVRRSRTPVTVFLVNGFQMRGTLRGFDNFVVLLESEGRQQMIFKHAISTVAPSRNLERPED